jgi:GAF domain-containing protein/HAMP domain-containing protein
LLFVGAALVALALLVSWLSTRAVVVPVRQLLAATRRVGSGDLTTPVPIVGRDEIAELGRGFEAMRKKLAMWGEELETAVKKRTRELSTLYAIDRAAAQSLELDEILNDALDKVLEVLEVEAGGIYLLEPDGVTMTLRVHRGLSDEFAKNVRQINLGEGVSGRAAAERKPVVLDLADYPSARLARYVAQEGFQTLASTALVSGGRPLGALNLGTRRPRAFPPEEMELLTAIGEQLGSAVQNARLFQEAQQRAERLSVLNRIARALSTTLNLDELLEVVHREVTIVMEADAFFIALYDHAANELNYRIRVDKGVREPQERRPLTPGLTASLVTSKKPIVIRDFERERDALPPAKLWGSMQAPPSWLGVPMLLGDNVVGVISVQAYRPNAYGVMEQEMLSTIADAVAVAVENARLYEAEQQRAARLAGLLRLGNELATLREESAVLDTLVTRAAPLAESPACTVMLVDEATNEAMLAAQTGLPEDTPLGLRVPLAFPIIRHSLETGDPIILPDINHYAPEMRRILVRLDIRAFFAYPMVRMGRTLGFITLSSLTPRTPSAEEITAYQLLAERAAAALENARLYQSLEESKAALEARVRDLERFTRLAVGRELRMKELKERLRELEEK